MKRSFEATPAETLFRDAWHQHDKADVGVWIKHRYFPTRFWERIGWLDPGVFEDHPKRDRYMTRWCVIPDMPYYLKAFCDTFDNYQCFTSLNHYPKSHAMLRAEIATLQDDLYWIESAKHPVGDLPDRIAALEEKLTPDCYVDLALDFDVGPEKKLVNLAAAIEPVKLLVAHLDRYMVPYQLFFSGGRGFHVVIDFRVMDQPLAANNHLINHQVVKLIQAEVGEEIGYDPALYSQRRQFRIVNSRHTSGRFKIPLLPDELDWPVERILELAEQPRTMQGARSYGEANNH